MHDEGGRCHVPQLRPGPAKSINKQMYKKIQPQRKAVIVSSFPPFMYRHPSHQKMESISLPPWIWTGLMTCRNPQEIRQKWHWSSFRPGLWEDGQLPCPPLGCQLPCAKKSSHMETLTLWGGMSPTMQRHHTEKERCLTSQDVPSIPVELPFLWMKRTSWTFYLQQHLQTTDEAFTWA